jgi:hypothetical protein
MLAPRAHSAAVVAVIMARKRKTAAERLRQEIAHASGPRLSDLVVKPNIGLSDERTREIRASAALSLEGEPSHSPLRRAFRTFRLDSNDPFNWRLLLSRLATIAFGNSLPRPRGARPKWDEHRRLLFKTDVARVRKQLTQIAKRRGLRPPTDDDVAAYLKYKMPDRYGSITEPSIRKYIVSGAPKGRR